MNYECISVFWAGCSVGLIIGCVLTAWGQYNKHHHTAYKIIQAQAACEMDSNLRERETSY